MTVIGVTNETEEAILAHIPQTRVFSSAEGPFPWGLNAGEWVLALKWCQWTTESTGIVPQ